VGVNLLAVEILFNSDKMISVNILTPGFLHYLTLWRLFISNPTELVNVVRYIVKKAKIISERRKYAQR